MRCALALLLLLIALPRPAHADPQVDLLIEQARREKAALRFQEALDVLDSALVLGRSQPADLIVIYRLAGELAAGLDDHEAAVGHFRRLLALAPDTVLPEGTSPKVTSPFAIALAATREYGPLRSDNDPVRMVAATRDGKLVDRHGNILLVLRPTPAPALGPARSPSPAPLDARPRPYAIAALAFAAGATYFALDAGSAQSDLDAIAAGERPGTTYRETLRIQSRGRRSALIANIGIGATAATAALATYLYVRERRRSSVTIEPTATSVAVALSLSF